MKPHPGATPLARILATAAVVVSLAGGSVTPAAAAAQQGLNGTALPAITVTENAAALGASTSGTTAAPDTVFLVPSEGTARSTLAIDSAGLPAEATLLGARTDITPVSLPENAKVRAAVVDSDPEQVWDSAQAFSQMLETVPGNTVLEWTFSSPGDYELLIGSTVSYSLPGQAAVAVKAPAVPFRFHVAAPSPEADAPAEAITRAPQGPEATETARDPAGPPPTTTAPAADAPAVKVLDTGDVSVSNQWQDNNLLLQLVDGQGKASDPGQTVLSVPTVEAWPGEKFAADSQEYLNWDLLLPAHGPVWRTRGQADSAGGAGLLIRPDAHGVSANDGGELFMGVSDASMPDGAAFTTFRTDSGYPAQRWRSDKLGAISDRIALYPDAEYPGEAEPMGFAFTKAGRYCLTLDSEMLHSSTGLMANDQATLTFAVGIDPAGVAPCAQPAPSAPFDPAPAPTSDTGTSVIDSGMVHLSPRAAEDGTLALGLNRVAGGKTSRFSPSATVLSIPAQDDEWPGTGTTGIDRQLWEKIAAPGSRLWRTAGATSYSPFSDPGLPLTLAPWADETAASQLTDGAYQLRLISSETPSGGYVSSYETQNDEVITGTSAAAAWDSRPGGRKDAIGASGFDGGYYPFAVPYNALGLAFTAPGRYCLTVESRASFTGGSDPVVGFATLTFAVGIDPSTTSPCAQQSGGEGPTNPGEDVYKDLDPTVTWFNKGHLDVGPKISDGNLTLHTGDVHSPGKFPSVKDAVWVGRGPDVSLTVPESRPGGPDYSLIGVPGTSYYGFTAGAAFVTSTLWPGLTHEGLPEQWKERKPTWTLAGFSGPEGGTFAMPGQRISSADVPASFDGPTSHQHQDWAFTKEGVYCLNFEIHARDSTTGTDAVVRDQLTVAIGDSVDLTTVQPCGRSNPEGPATAAQPLDPAALQSNPTSATKDDSVALTPFVRDGNLHVASQLAVTGKPRSWHAPESLVIGGFTNNGANWQSRNSQALFQSGLALPTGSTREDVTVQVGDVTGPGTVRFEYYPGQSFGTEAEQSRSAAFWPQYLATTTPSFSASGTYCVPMTWSTVLDSGKAVTTTRTLTFAVGAPDPSSVKPCAQGGQATKPEEPGTSTPGPIRWDVPNGTKTVSGATIVNRGHVDIASVLSGGALDTKIKDSSLSGEPVWRDPSDVVLQLSPASRTEVAAMPDYAFLGPGGRAAWVLPETQDDRLLWPGWSTEAIADAETTSAFRWQLTNASGPGEFALFQTVMGKPSVLFNTRDGITAADTTTVPKHTHAHGTWAFSAEGVYCLAFERSTSLSSGQVSADAFTVAVAVGIVDVTAINPARCFTDAPGKPAVVDTSPVAPEQLTEATGGAVQVLSGDHGFFAGQLVTVQVGKAHAGKWVSAWLHPGSAWLGWVQVGSSGAIQVRLPADAAAGAHKIAVENQDGSLIGWDSLSVVAAPATPTGTAPAPAEPTPPRNVGATQCVAGATVLASGHVDYASRIVGGKLESLVGDDSSGTKAYREPGNVILWVKPSSQTTLPAGYAAVGPAGSTIWQVPQTQDKNLVWLGWNTEALNSGNARGSVSWTLDSVSGPGSVKVFQSGVFGGVQSMILDGNGSSYSIPLGIHAHANWAFSAQGIYRLKMTQSVTLPNGQRSSDTETLTLAVGNVDPASAAAPGTGCGTISNAMLGSDDQAATLQAAVQATAEANHAVRKLLPGESTVPEAAFANPFTAFSEGNPVPLLLMILGALLLIGALGAGFLWWRRRNQGIQP